MSRQASETTGGRRGVKSWGLGVLVCLVSIFDPSSSHQQGDSRKMASAGYYQNPQQQEPGAPPQAYYGAGQQQHQQNPYPQAGYGGMQQNSYPQPQYQPPPPQDQQVNYGQKPGELV